MSAYSETVGVSIKSFSEVKLVNMHFSILDNLLHPLDKLIRLTFTQNLNQMIYPFLQQVEFCLFNAPDTYSATPSASSASQPLQFHGHCCKSCDQLPNPSSFSTASEEKTQNCLMFGLFNTCISKLSPASFRSLHCVALLRDVREVQVLQEHQSVIP